MSVDALLAQGPAAEKGRVPSTMIMIIVRLMIMIIMIIIAMIVVVIIVTIVRV